MQPVAVSSRTSQHLEEKPHRQPHSPASGSRPRSPALLSAPAPPGSGHPLEWEQVTLVLWVWLLPRGVTLGAHHAAARGTSLLVGVNTEPQVCGARLTPAALPLPALGRTERTVYSRRGRSALCTHAGVSLTAEAWNPPDHFGGREGTVPHRPPSPVFLCPVLHLLLRGTADAWAETCRLP